MCDSAPIGMIVRDLDGRIASTNTTFERMVGYSSDELPQIDTSALFDGTREGLEQERRFVAKAAASAGDAST